MCGSSNVLSRDKLRLFICSDWVLLEVVLANGGNLSVNMLDLWVLPKDSAFVILLP